MTARPPFWRTKTLGQMTKTEWELLCDGCGKCCVHKLEDEVTGEFFGTNVCCRLLDTQSCRCKNYRDRKTWVPDCIKITPEVARNSAWLPATCAYRLLADGNELPDWHPLVTGDPDSTHKAGMSVRGKVLSETDAGELEDHILDEPL